MLKGKKRYLIPALLILGIVLGPKPDYPVYDANIPELQIPLEDLVNYIAEKEAKFSNIKPENESRIIWADTIRKTPYSVVYLHGFSASAMEGAPMHWEFAKRYGCNLYLPRLAEHGLNDEDALLNLTPAALVNTAKEAIAIGKLLGKKVIVMSCSTGGTLSAYLAANNPADIEAQIMYSPNIQIYDGTSKVLTMPWGVQLGKAMSGDYYSWTHEKPEVAKYWTMRYRMEGLVALQALIDKTMTDDVFMKIKQPTFLGFYYKNEEEQDKVISTDAIRHFYKTIQTPKNKKEMIEFPNVDTHVVISDLQSKDLESVRMTTFKYAEEVLGLEPIVNEF